MKGGNWIDRAIGYVAPASGLRRQRARVAQQLLVRHYEGASVGRRTEGWHRSIADANAAMAPYVGRLRDVARDLVRNNPYAESALTTIADHTVGWGIVAKTSDQRMQAAWNAWAGTSACDADGRHDLAGLQKLVMRTVAESGEVLVRRRIRRPDDGLPIPLQLQVLEGDFLDTLKHGITTPGGGRIVYGVEFDAIGRRVAYWLYPEHPGNAAWSAVASQRIPAEGVLHIYKSSRPGQVRGASWLAPVIVRFKEFDEFEDATLMKQKIAACLAVMVSDSDGSNAPLGGTGDDSTTPGIDYIEPGSINNLPGGKNVTVVDPPKTSDYDKYCQVTLRAIAAGLGVTYEDLTGDYQGMPFSAARMSRLRHWARVDDWRYRLIIPQFCEPVWAWARDTAVIMGKANADATAQWTAPPPPMIEPDKEGLAYQRLIRTGIMTLSEAIRERGYDPAALLEEYAADNTMLDRLKIWLDSDPRRMSQAGLTQERASLTKGAEAPAAGEADDEAAA